MVGGSLFSRSPGVKIIYPGIVTAPLTIFFEGWLLGWAIAWPPGPINLEMIRRGLTRGAWPALVVGLGACTGDFLWALVMNSGATALGDNPKVKLALSVLSTALLFFIAYSLLKSWFKAVRNPAPTSTVVEATTAPTNRRNGYLIGLSLSFTSPWNIAFWFALAGQTVSYGGGFNSRLLFAGAVLTGALCWILILSTAAGLGSRWIQPGQRKHADLLAAVFMIALALKTFAVLFATYKS